MSKRKVDIDAHKKPRARDYGAPLHIPLRRIAEIVLSDDSEEDFEVPATPPPDRRFRKPIPEYDPDFEVPVTPPPDKKKRKPIPIHDPDYEVPVTPQPVRVPYGNKGEFFVVPPPPFRANNVFNPPQMKRNRHLTVLEEMEKEEERKKQKTSLYSQWMRSLDSSMI